VIGCQKVYDFRTSTGHLQKKIRKIDESRDSKFFPYSTKLETQVPAGKGQFGTLWSISSERRNKHVTLDKIISNNITKALQSLKAKSN
jgi:hypothetical protein